MRAKRPGSARFSRAVAGPIDNGENRCTEIRSYPGLAELGAGKR